MSGPTSRYRALVVGGTGAVGSSLIRELLNSPACIAIVSFGRRHTDMFDKEPNIGKLSQKLVDMNKLETDAVVPQDSIRYVSRYTRMPCCFSEMIFTTKRSGSCFAVLHSCLTGLSHSARLVLGNQPRLFLRSWKKCVDVSVSVVPSEAGL